jgi:hypothetical protein
MRECSKGRRWSEAIVVVGFAFAEKVKTELGITPMHHKVEQAGESYALRESKDASGCEFAQVNVVLTPKITIQCQKFAETAET